MRAGAVLLLLVWLGGCASPAKRAEDRAREQGFQRDIVQGQAFPHVVYRNAAPPGVILHVYIDSDGTPWSGSVPSADPTPRHPVMLELMGLDRSPSVYLGRPCYHGLAESPACDPRHWTTDRYSRQVVDSLGEVVGKVLADGRYRGVAWFGHSGGGALAVLLAARFPQTAAVVTLGANLDTAAWARFAGQDLSGSLNPVATVSPFPSHLYQRHYAGSDDRIVPPSVSASAAVRLGQPLTVIEGFRHGCCWATMWPKLLKDVEAATGE